MTPTEPGLLPEKPAAHAVLLVDDEPQACKWFARRYGDEFVVYTAGSVDEALELLAARGHEVAVLLTDYRMPGRDGTARRGATPLWPCGAAAGLGLHRQRHGDVRREPGPRAADIGKTPGPGAHPPGVARGAGRQRGARESVPWCNAAPLRERPGFLAHEVATPLATVRGYLTAMRDRHQAAPDDDDAVAHLSQRRPGEVLHMIDAAQRRADYAQSLVSTFVQSARDAYQTGAPVGLLASELVVAARDEYPFDGDEAQWLVCDALADFSLPGRRDLPPRSARW
jgi:two-component system response regulator PhcR